VRKLAIVTSASGAGGTTVGREIATRLDLPFYELDAIFWRPNWEEPDGDEFRKRVAKIVATDSWVIDGSYQSWIGQLALGSADVVVCSTYGRASGFRGSFGERCRAPEAGRSCGTATVSRSGTHSRAATR